MTKILAPIRMSNNRYLFQVCTYHENDIFSTVFYTLQSLFTTDKNATKTGRAVDLVDQVAETLACEAEGWGSYSVRVHIFVNRDFSGCFFQTTSN